VFPPSSEGQAGGILVILHTFSEDLNFFSEVFLFFFNLGLFVKDFNENLTKQKFSFY
jgi:hypothetical protein